jgi:hypothetical protein
MDLRSTDALTAGIQYRSYECRKHGLSYRALLAFERFARGITHSERTDPALRTHSNRPVWHPVLGRAAEGGGGDGARLRPPSSCKPALHRGRRRAAAADRRCELGAGCACRRVFAAVLRRCRPCSRGRRAATGRARGAGGLRVDGEVGGGGRPLRTGPHANFPGRGPIGVARRAARRATAAPGWRRDGWAAVWFAALN